MRQSVAKFRNTAHRHFALLSRAAGQVLVKRKWLEAPSRGT